MSAINGYDHSYMGEIAGIPLYLLMEDTNDPEFAFAQKGQILLGGGSGEHPPLLVKDNLQALITFMTYGENGNDAVYFQSENCKTLSKEKFEQLDGTRFDGFIFCTYDGMGWTWNDKAKFIQRMQDQLHDPHFDDSTKNAELILLASIGELIFFSFPEWFPELIDEYKKWHLATRLSAFDGKPYQQEPMFRNVKIDPPGYHHVGGRKLMPCGEKIQWGISAYDK